MQLPAAPSRRRGWRHGEADEAAAPPLAQQEHEAPDGEADDALDAHADGGKQSAAAEEAASGFAGGGGADSDALAGTGDAPLARPTPIRPTAARLPPSKVVLSELGRPTAFFVRLPVPAPSTLARGAGTRRSGATAGGATDSDAVGGPGEAAAGRRAENDGAGAVAGWLAGLGLGRYAERCWVRDGTARRWVRPAGCRSVPPRAASYSASRRWKALLSSCPLSAVERRRGPGRSAASESTPAARVPAASSSFLPNPVPPVSDLVQAVAELREEDLLRLGVLPGHARRIVARAPSLLLAATGSRDATSPMAFSP